jgi:23S rRNA (adenine2503-C2)-methyltransferase
MAAARPFNVLGLPTTPSYRSGQLSVFVLSQQASLVVAIHKRQSNHHQRPKHDNGQEFACGGGDHGSQRNLAVVSSNSAPSNSTRSLGSHKALGSNNALGSNGENVDKTPVYVKIASRPRRTMPGPRRYDLRPDDVAALVGDEPAYRVKQIWEGLYEQARDIDEITSLPKALRAKLAAEPTFDMALDTELEKRSEHGETIKWLWSLIDGAAIETVLMHYEERSTVCISSQAGCAMACGFCATGQAGFERQLTSGEIIEQVIRARRRSTEDGRRLSNVVFMGMGEPMANYDAVWRAVEVLHHDLGMSARHLTISTVGIIPGIKRLTQETLPVNLAVSLHAAEDKKRDSLVPINRQYPLGDLAEACGAYVDVTGRRLSFEWALIADVNDTMADARQLAAYARPLKAHVNLIPLNPTPGYPTVGTNAAGVRAFRDQLQDFGINATIRRNRGTGIDAACGQLRSRALNLTPKPAAASKPDQAPDNAHTDEEQ